MKKNVITSALLASLVLSAGMGIARADDESKVIVTGRITSSTCDIGATTGVKSNGTSGGTIELGTASSVQFVDGTTVVNPHPFSISFTNCPADTGATTNRALSLSGLTIQGHNDVFNDFTGNTGGVQVKSNNKVLKAGDKVDSGQKASGAVNAVIPFVVGMIVPSASKTTPAVTQDINATLTFAADYM